MFKPNFLKFKCLPATLGYLLAVAVLAFAVAMCWPTPARAETLHCTQHKAFFGLRDGWDCAVPAATDRLTVTTDPGTVWCNQGTTLCKGTGHATLRINRDALAALGKPRQFQIAMSCTTRPGSADADCKFAAKGWAAK